VNETLAESLWPGEEAIGKHLQLTSKWVPSPPRGRSFQVVGVVHPIRSIVLSKLDAPAVYLPLRPDDPAGILIRTHDAPAVALPAIHGALSDMDPALDAKAILIGLEDGPLRVEALMSRAGAAFTMVLGTLAFVLAIAGVFATVAYAVSMRTREIGIRMALGAKSGQVVNLIVREGLRPVSFGLVCGVGLAIALAAALHMLEKDPTAPDPLYGISPVSPEAFGLIAVLVLSASWLAAYLPAREASTVAPSVALRRP